MILDTTLIIDAKKARLNIERMVKKARKNNLEFRPHFKTHQSLGIGNWFRDEGVKGITVSSIRMADFFANDGWNSITIAFPVNTLESKRINSLAANIDIRVLATNKTVLNKLNSALSNKVGVYIELDPGYGRSGVPILDFEIINELKQIIINANHLRFEGFYAHLGHSYKCRSQEEIKNLVFPILKDLKKLKKEFNEPICFGDTPSCSVLDDFGVISQISAGNFVFYDWTQVQIGSCSPNEIAIGMYVPVVGKNDSKKELLIHGGAVHFSKDSFTDVSGLIYYGVVAEQTENGWGDPLPDNKLISVSQEHGIVKCDSNFFNKTNIGEVITILPIHSCLTADLMGSYSTLSGDTLDHMNKRLFS